MNTNFIHTPLTSADLSVSDMNIYFVDPEIDTIDISGMSLEFEDILFTQQDTLSFPNLSSVTGEISLKRLDSKYFHESGVTCNITGGDNVFEIMLNSSDKISGFVDKAELVIDIRGLGPSYELMYELNDIQIDSILQNYYGQDIMSGTVNLSTSLYSSGADLDVLLENASGTILVEGEGIIMKGFDLDEILSNYKRSQKFKVRRIWIRSYTKSPK